MSGYNTDTKQCKIRWTGFIHIEIMAKDDVAISVHFKRIFRMVFDMLNNFW